jgi:chromosome segregation ATPase
VALEIVQVTIAQNSVAANLVAPMNEEVVVTLEPNLEMQLGLRLVESDRQYRLVLMPRTTISGRRRPLVPVDLEKESAKAKAQLTENRRELVTAGNQLKSLPAEIRRVSNIKPGTPQEASMRQGRLNQLEKIGKSLQSKVRRLSEADPKLSKSIEQLDQIQQSLSRMNGQVRVQFRIYATGNAGDFQLLGTETEKLVAAMR